MTLDKIYRGDFWIFLSLHKSENIINIQKNNNKNISQFFRNKTNKPGK